MLRHRRLVGRDHRSADILRGHLRSDLDGVIQFEFQPEVGPPVFRYVELLAGHVTSGDGLASTCDAWVSALELELEGVLRGCGAVPGALRVSGAIDLFTGMLSQLSAVGTPVRAGLFRG